jgi:phage terminase large subunit-like protein
MKYPHVEAGEKYARQVIAGTIPACKWVRLACERHFKDKTRKTSRWKFEAVRAERKARFVELFPHTKGKWAANNEPFILEPWQCFMVLSIFGWVDRHNAKIRRFIRALLMIPRKNGKSDCAARIGLAMFADDEEFGAEVYSGATSVKQAWEVFGPANKMANRTLAFQEHYGVQVMSSNLSILANGSKFEPVIGKPGDGASPSCAITDEYHEHADDTLLDTMETGMAARERPLSLIVTTAGDNLSGPCYALQKELEKILEGTRENERFWGIAYTIDDGDAWDTEEAQRKANPNYGISVDADFLAGKLHEAKHNARKQGVYKTKHLNIWVGALQAYFNMQAWHRCAKLGLQPEEFKGLPLFVGMDLASKIDIAAVYLLFKIDQTHYAGFGRFYIPESQIANGLNEHYAGWAENGHMIVTGGQITDFDQIEKDLAAIHKSYGISGLAFDPAQSPMLATHLMETHQIPMVEMKTTVANCAEPMKMLDGFILSQDKQFLHNGDPCMTWMMSNVVCSQRLLLKDLAFPEKDKAENKIDGPVAAISGLNLALAHKMPEASVYENRGVLIL